MATPFPPCGYSHEEVMHFDTVDSNMCCTILSDDGTPCGRELKDHPSQAQLTAQLTSAQPPGK